MTARRTSKAAVRPEQTDPAESTEAKEGEGSADQMHALARELIIDAYNLQAVDPKVMKVLVDDEDGRKAVIDQLAWMRSIEVDHVGVAHRAGVPELLDELPPVDPLADPLADQLADGEDKQED